VRGFLKEAENRAAMMDPIAGRRVVAAATAMVASAEDRRFREKVGSTIHNSIQTGFWAQMANDLAALGGGGLDITGDGKPDIDVASIEQLGEGFAAQLDDPNLDPAQVLSDYETAVELLEHERTKLVRRVRTHNEVRAGVDQWVLQRSPPFGAGGTPQSRGEILPLEIEAEINSMLEQFRRGELGDGERTEFEFKASVWSLLNGKRRIPLPPGHPFGDAIEVDARAANALPEGDLLNVLGLGVESREQRVTRRVTDAFERAAKIAGPIISGSRLSPEEAEPLISRIAQRIDALAYPSEPLDFGYGPTPGALTPPIPTRDKPFKWAEYPDAGQWVLDGIVERVQQSVGNGQQAGEALVEAGKFFNLDLKSIPEELKEDVMRRLGVN
jgi:hypothetical protein